MDDKIITANDIKAIRKAVDVVLQYDRGRSYINCIMDENDRTKDIEIDCGVEITNYKGLGKYNLGDVLSASHVITYCKYDDVWQTVVRILRPGDNVKIRWLANNNNQYLTNAGLYQDQVMLVIRRGVRKLTFLLASSVCKNDTAKMIRHTSTPKSILDYHY